MPGLQGRRSSVEGCRQRPTVPGNTTGAKRLRPFVPEDGPYLLVHQGGVDRQHESRRGHHLGRGPQRAAEAVHVEGVRGVGAGQIVRDVAGRRDRDPGPEVAEPRAPVLRGVVCRGPPPGWSPYPGWGCPRRLALRCGCPRPCRPQSRSLWRSLSRRSPTVPARSCPRPGSSGPRGLLPCVCHRCRRCGPSRWPSPTNCPRGRFRVRCSPGLARGSPRRRTRPSPGRCPLLLRAPTRPSRARRSCRVRHWCHHQRSCTRG
jgi:hypothetical protein